MRRIEGKGKKTMQHSFISMLLICLSVAKKHITLQLKFLFRSLHWDWVLSKGILKTNDNISSERHHTAVFRWKKTGPAKYGPKKLVWRIIVVLQFVITVIECNYIICLFFLLGGSFQFRIWSLRDGPGIYNLSRSLKWAQDSLPGSTSILVCQVRRISNCCNVVSRWAALFFSCDTYMGVEPKIGVVLPPKSSVKK